jgi:hypothetical protein
MEDIRLRKRIRLGFVIRMIGNANTPRLYGSNNRKEGTMGHIPVQR